MTKGKGIISSLQEWPDIFKLINRKKGMLIVVSAPSGTGKTTLCRKLVNEIDKAVFSVSLTSRPPRPGEKNGRDYFFFKEKDFKQRADQGQLLEWARVHGSYYGTSAEFVRRGLEKGSYLFFDIDVQGGKQIKKKFPEAVLIFLMPPSMEELKKRITGRKSDSEKEIQKRLSNARSEINAAGFYDYLVINSDIDQAAKDLKSIIKAESLKIKKIS